MGTKAISDGLTRSQRYRRKRRIAKYGLDYADADMRGRHGNHATGSRNARWNGGKWIHENGYIAIAVKEGTPHRMKNGYAYLHLLKAEMFLGRSLKPSEKVHHINGNVRDNRLANLLICDASKHGRIHAVAAKRNNLGQFLPGLKRI